jgi:hypothetical protein
MPVCVGGLEGWRHPPGGDAPTLGRAIGTCLCAIASETIGEGKRPVDVERLSPPLLHFALDDDFDNGWRETRSVSLSGVLRPCQQQLEHRIGAWSAPEGHPRGEYGVSDRP